jgi:ribonuclease BN (tRNA processing enzyme)
MTVKSTLTAIACLIAILVGANAQNSSTGDAATGTWKAENVGFAPWTFSLQSNAGKLTGTVSQGAFDPPTRVSTTLTTPTPIQDGVIDGNRVSFKCMSPGGVRTIVFKGVIDGDSIAFTREVQVRPGGDPGMNGIYGASGAARFTAKRVGAASPALTERPPLGGSDPQNASLVLLGTGTPIPDPDRSGPAVAVVAGGTAYLVDAGPGVVRRAREAADKTGITALVPVRLNFLFLTHLHSDHTLGYPDLIFTPAVNGRPGPLEVFGPKGTEEMTGHLMAAWKKDMDVRINGLEHGNANAYKVNVHEIDPGVVYRDANITVKAFLVKHATWDQAFGYGFETPNRSIVVSGDTAPTPAIAEACNGCDVLLHEVYCNPPSGRGSPYFEAAHTSAAELAEIAKQAKPKLLVLYHQLNAGCSGDGLLEQVRRSYAGVVVSANDLDVF